MIRVCSDDNSRLDDAGKRSTSSYQCASIHLNLILEITTIIFEMTDPFPNFYSNVLFLFLSKVSYFGQRIIYPKNPFKNQIFKGTEALEGCKNNYLVFTNSLLFMLAAGHTKVYMKNVKTG